MHLRFHDIDRSRCRVAAGLQVGKRRGDSHESVHDSFRNVASIGEPDGRVRHQMADIANQHQRSRLQPGGAAVGRCVAHVLGKPARDRATTLGEGFFQCAAHEPEPVGVGQNLVLGVDSGDGIFTIHDARQCRFGDHVVDSGGITAADGASGINPDHDMEAVIAKHNHLRRRGITAMTGESRGCGKPGVGAVKRDRQRGVGDGQSRHVTPAAAGERKGLVEKGANAGDHLGTTDRVIAGPAGFAVRRNGVGPVEGVIQTAIAGVGGVQRIAGIGDGHHELRSGNSGNLGIHVRGFDNEIVAFLDQITDLTEKGVIGSGINGRAAIVMQPGIDLRLHIAADRQQLAVFRRQPVNRRIEPVPETVGRDAAAFEQLCVDEIGELAGNRQVSTGDIVRHACLQ